jgi:hypothetical protein
MLESLITSKTRIKLLIKFFLNPETKSYLRQIAEEFGESTNSVRVELNRLAEAEILTIQSEGRTKQYQANEKHPLFGGIREIVNKTVGLDHLVDDLVSRLGELQFAFISGDYAQGIDSGLIDLVLVGRVDAQYLDQPVRKVEKIINRKVRTLVLNETEFSVLKNKKWGKNNLLLLWSKDTQRKQ